MNITISNGTNVYVCQVTTVTTMIALVVLLGGLISNIVLLGLVLKKLASGKRNDKLFLVNTIAANIFCLLGSLLGQILGRGKIIPSAQKYDIYYHQVSFISLFNNLTSMAALCFILYENIVKFPANRLLSFSLSLKIVASTWFLSLILVPAAQSGFIISDKQSKGIIKNTDRTPSSEEIASFFSVIVLITLVISITSYIIRISLTGISTKLKQHREQTEQVIKNTSLVKIVSFKKQAYAMVLCYSVCWVPFGFAAGLTAVNIISFHSCVYFSCLVGAHISAATTPLIYLTIDKRFRISCFKTREKTTGRRINTSY